MNLDTPAARRWHQVNIHFTDYATTEDTVATHLYPVLRQAEDDGLLDSWWFIRKAPCWRLRYHPSKSTPQAAQGRLHSTLDTMQQHAKITRWVETIYEPETHAFGGDTAMRLAHRLFHQDSRHLLEHLANTSDGGDHRAELGVLLATALMRGARQDWYEQGDIWAVLAANRPLAPGTTPAQVNRLETNIRRLLTADLLVSGVNRPSHTEGSIADLVSWAGAFHSAGEHMAHLAQDGALQRGLRAVLAHHVIFSWNRLGLAFPVQAVLTHAARAVILTDS